MPHTKLSKAVRWTAESLNEYAALMDSGEDAPGHSPASPGFWFHGLARETGPAFLASPSAAALLTESAIHKLRERV